MPNGTPFCDFSRGFCALVSAATSTECLLSQGAETALEVVRMADNKQFDANILPGDKGYGADAFRYSGRPVVGLSVPMKIRRHQPSTAISFPWIPLRGAERSSAQSGPRPAGNGRGQGRTPSQSPACQMGSRNNPIVINVNKSIPDYADPWLDTSSNCWPLDEHHYAELFAVCSPSRPMTLLYGAAYLHRPPVLPPSEKTGAKSAIHGCPSRFIYVTLDPPCKRAS